MEKTWEIIWKSDTLFMEFWIALYTLLSGMMFFSGQINSYYTGSVYEIISAVVSQNVWGGLLIAIAIIQLVVLYENRYRWQKWTYASSTVFWVFISSIVGFGNGHTWIFFNIIMVAMANIWLYLRTARKFRIRKEVREELELHRIHADI